MSEKDGHLPKLSKDALYRQIALNQAPIGRAALLTLFAEDGNSGEELDEILAELAGDSEIIQDNRGYRAVKPWADVAYAIVGAAKGEKRVPVQIVNLPQEDSIPVTLPQADIKKHNLKPGTRIVVGLDRGGNGIGLRARFLAFADRPFQLVGTFNRAAGNFAPLDHSIKTSFQLPQEHSMDKLPHQFLIELPPDFDIRRSAAIIAPHQDKDSTSGEDITRIVAHKYELDRSHPQDVLDEARNFSLQRLDYKERTDLRHLDFVTVDPLGAKDLDDAFYATIEPDGYAVYTAIADVTAIVPYGSKVDREAYRRGTTFYLGDSVKTAMLPESLSARKCSLLPNRDRMAIIVKQMLDWDGHLTGSDIFAGVIRSRSQLSYGQFYDLLERDDPRFRTIARVHDLWRKNNLIPETRNALQESSDTYTSKSIIETLMVQTNSLIPKFLTASGMPFLSRNYESCADKNFAAPRAYYDTCHVGHAQLGLRHYAHTTSPIRRYADIVNLRALHRALGNTKLGITDEEIAGLDKIAAHLNERRRIERDADHDMEKHHAIYALTRMQNTPVRVAINEIAADFVEVTLVQSGLRKRLFASTLPANQWQIDAEKRELVLLGDQGREVRRYHRTETVLGQIYNVDPAKAQWFLKLVPPEQNIRPQSQPSVKPF